MKFSTANNLSLKVRLIRARRFLGVTDADLRNVELTDAEAHAAFSAGEKTQLPLLVTDQLVDASGRAVNASLLIADFDRKDMPQGMDEVQLRACLAGLEDALLFDSASGMPKAAWLTSQAVSREEGVELLKAKLPAELHWFDTKGLFKCFISETSARVLQSQLLTRTVHTVEAGQVLEMVKPSSAKQDKAKLSTAQHDLAMLITRSSNICNIPNVTHTYLFQTTTSEQIPDRLRHVAKTKDQKAILTLLLSCWNLLNPLGYGLSQHRIAQQLNIDVMQVNRYLKQLQRLGLLFKTSKTYCQGVKAQCYRAQSILASTIRKLKASSKAKPKVTHWENGNTYRPMLSLLWKHQTLDLPSWLHLVQSIPGATPARLNDAARYWQCQRKKLYANNPKLKSQA